MTVPKRDPGAFFQPIPLPADRADVQQAAPSTIRGEVGRIHCHRSVTLDPEKEPTEGALDGW